MVAPLAAWTAASKEIVMGEEGVVDSADALVATREQN